LRQDLFDPLDVVVHFFPLQDTGIEKNDGNFNCVIRPYQGIHSRVAITLNISSFVAACRPSKLTVLNTRLVPFFYEKRQALPILVQGLHDRDYPTIEVAVPLVAKRIFSALSLACS